MQHPPEPKLEQLWQRQHWPTWALMVGVYGAWIALMNYASLLSWWLVSPLCALLLCLHGSIQHELIHGHPSPWKRLNDALGWPPLSMWIPYFQYRDHHRLHHQTSVLTQPGLDPESYYHWPSNWHSMGGIMQTLWWLNHTFIGRMIIGPWLVIGIFLHSEVKQLAKGKLYDWRNWGLHLILVSVMMMWLHSQEVLWWQYLVFCVWPGLSLTLARSYAEHRPGNNNHERCAIIEGSWFTRVLFMNVNIHQVHHEFPKLPWFMVYPHWQRHRQAIIKRNGGYYYRGYWSLIKQTLWRQKDSPIYPEKPSY
ncbi:MAG: fatty acid desaturase [Oceanospirillaceae bacterium]|nr:fatty acid desaturase [Oceanospirillaceae bacterium]